MPHDRSALTDQLGALLTQQRFNSVVVHNYCRSAEHFLEYLAQRDIAVGEATPEHVYSTTLAGASAGVTVVRQRGGWQSIPRAGIHSSCGNPFLVRESIPRAGIHELLRLVQKRWPQEPPAACPAEARCRSICNEYQEWLHVQRGLAKVSIRALIWGPTFLSWYTARGAVDELAELDIRDIDIYFEMRAAGPRRRSLKDVAERLRSLMRFLHRTGRIRVDLAPGIIGPVLYAYESGEPGLLDDPARAAQACGNPNGGRPNRGSSSSLKQK